mgnify:FL=1
MALVLLHFAKNSGPLKFGELSFYLVLISYSAFAVFGINASYVKHFSISQIESDREKFTILNFWYNLILGVIVLIFILALVRGNQSYSLAAICFLNLIRGSIQSIFRAEINVWRLCLFNAIFSLMYLSCYIIGVVNHSSYDAQTFLDFWALALIVSIVFGVCLIFSKLTRLKNYDVGFVRDKFYVFFKNGVSLFLIGFGNTALLSADRLLLNLFSAPLDVVGYYQFADSISLVFYLGSNSILFLIAPMYMRQISDGVIGPDEFMSKSLRVGVLWFIPLIVFSLLGFLSIEFYFVDFQASQLLVLLLSLSKFFCLFLFIPVTLFSVFHYESVLMKTYCLIILPMIFLQAVFIIFVKTYWILPIISIIAVLTILFILCKLKSSQLKTVDGL